jgi:hypothetical protein
MHLGIGLFLGMWTFGLAMIIANLSFVSPWVVRRILDRRSAAIEPTEQGRGAQSTDINRSKTYSTSRKTAASASLAATRK